MICRGVSESGMVRNKRIRVLISDDHAMIRKGLVRFLMVFDDFELVGEASDAQETFEICKEYQPDVVLMDLMMPEVDGAETIRKVRHDHPFTQVIGLTSIPEGEMLDKALEAGAIGLVQKNVSTEALARAIRTAVEGNCLEYEEENEPVDLHDVLLNPDKPGFTGREQEVIGYLVEGLKNREIAQKMGVSLATAKFHVSNILTKLAVHDRQEAALRVLERNWA